MYIARYFTLLLQLLHLFVVIGSTLPDYLKVVTLCQFVKCGHDTFVEGTGSKASTYHQDGFSCRIQSKKIVPLTSLLIRDHQILPTGIAGEYYLLLRKETLHAIIGHTNHSRPLCQHLVGDTSV